MRSLLVGLVALLFVSCAIAIPTDVTSKVLMLNADGQAARNPEIAGEATKQGEATIADTTDAGTTDAGTADAGTTDAGTTDAGTTDADTTDEATITDTSITSQGTSTDTSVTSTVTSSADQAVVKSEETEADEAEATTLEDKLAQLGPIRKTSCQPLCTWQCDSPQCPAQCHPVCERPQCEFICEEVPSATCEPKCDGEPVCSVRCPTDLCQSEVCPKCETVCNPAKCHASCMPPEVKCEPRCKETNCNWMCDKPAFCARPTCHLSCEHPACEVPAERECCECSPKTIQLAYTQAPAMVQQHAHLMPSLLEVISTMKFQAQTKDEPQCCPCQSPLY